MPGHPNQSTIYEPSLRFEVRVDGRSVPASLWLPASDCFGLVLAGHGGSGHKESSAIGLIVESLLPQAYAVLAIDGPVHGARRTDGNLDPEVARQAFRDAWRSGMGRDEMTDDWIAALDHVSGDARLAGVPIGYIGVSMGTAYGLPFLASDKRVRAAAVGLWSTTYTASEHLAAAAHAVDCPIWFTQQWDDQVFDRAGTAALFDAIGATDKRLVAYPGPHLELSGERLDDAITFLVKRLTTQATLSRRYPTSRHQGDSRP
jgi:dienelactone hydrolase